MPNQYVKQFRKRLIKSLTDLITLRMIENNELSGYDVIGAFHDEYRHLHSSGTVYSVLYSLERRGLIHGEWKGRKRVYTMTSEGQKGINEFRNSTDPFIEAFKAIVFKRIRKVA